jgi:hypothetical protein
MPAPPDPASPSRPPTPGSTSTENAKTPAVKASPGRSAGFRVTIEAANISIESDFPIINLRVFDRDLTFQIDCEVADGATILIVPTSEEQVLPNLLLSDHPDGPMTPGQATPDGRLFKIICGVPVGLTWDPERTTG